MSDNNEFDFDNLFDDEDEDSAFGLDEEEDLPSLGDELDSDMPEIEDEPEAPGPNRTFVVLAGMMILLFVAALVVVLAVTNILLWRQLNLAGQANSNSMQVIGLANTQYSPGAMGELVMDQSGTYGTLVVANLANLAPERQYQIWLIKGNAHISAGVFSVNPEGYASHEVIAPDPLVYYDAIGISIEPAGGKGITIRIGRLGYACPNVAWLNTMAIPMAPNVANIFIECPL